MTGPALPKSTELEPNRRADLRSEPERREHESGPAELQPLAGLREGPPPARRSTPRAILHLQRRAGNAAISRLLAGSLAQQRPARPAAASAPAPAPPAPALAAPEASVGHDEAAEPAHHAADQSLGTPTAPPEGPQAPGVAAALALGAPERPASVQRGLLDAIGEGLASIRNRVLRTFGEWARRIPGYGLLCVVLGRDPVTSQPVPRTAVAVVGGIVSLIPGGQAMFENLQRAGAVQRAADWLSGEWDKLGLTWDAIRALFSRVWGSFGASDLLNPSAAWQRVVAIFGPPLDRLRTFAVAAGGKLLEFVFEGVLTLAGGFGAQVMGIIRRAGDVLGRIVRDPLGFAGNLIAAVRGGLSRFMANIGTHLRSGLFAWLTGALGGVVRLPARLDWRGILGFILDLLGLTWAALRARLVGLVGEPRVAFLERAVDWIQTLVTGGLGAIADRILSYATNLLDTVLGGIRDWVANSVVGAAITRLITMFNPVGAVIQAIIAVYNTIQFFIERARQLGALATSIFDSIAAIASGSIGAAVAAVEQAMARTLPVVLGFLARLIGLGDIAAPVRNVIGRVRSVIDRALDRVVGWLAGMARRIGGRLRGRDAPDARSPQEKERAVQDAAHEANVLLNEQRLPLNDVRRRLPAIQRRHRVASLQIKIGGSPAEQLQVSVEAVQPARSETEIRQMEGPTLKVYRLLRAHGFADENIRIAGPDAPNADVVAFDERRVWFIELKGRKDWMSASSLRNLGNDPARQLAESIRGRLGRKLEPFGTEMTLGQYLDAPTDVDPARAGVRLVATHISDADALLALESRRGASMRGFEFFPLTMTKLLDYLEATVRAHGTRQPVTAHYMKIAEIGRRWRGRSRSQDIGTWLHDNADLAGPIEEAYAACRQVQAHELGHGETREPIDEDVHVRLLPVLRNPPQPPSR